MVEPGGLPSMGSHRVGHDCACGKHTSPPLLRLSPPRPLYTCYLSFHCQVAEDSFRPSENGGWAFWGGSCFIFTSNLHRFGILFLSSLFLPPEFIPWQHASGLVGAPMHPPVLLLVKTQREAPYQFPGRRRVVAPRACMWMWFGAFPGAFGLGSGQPQRRGTSP